MYNLRLHMHINNIILQLIYFLESDHLFISFTSFISEAITSSLSSPSLLPNSPPLSLSPLPLPITPPLPSKTYLTVLHSLFFNLVLIMHATSFTHVSMHHKSLTVATITFLPTWTLVPLDAQARSYKTHSSYRSMCAASRLFYREG